MPRTNQKHGDRLTGHALRNHHLRQKSLVRAAESPPLARTIVEIRASQLDMTRLEFARRSGISRGTMRDIELGVHVPTRQTLRRFIEFCRKRGVAPARLEKLLDVYAGPCDTLEHLIARLELRAGSSRELARRVGISCSTLWEYRRGNAPLPWLLARKLCESVQEDPSLVEPLWCKAERQRLIQRGYPEAWAELCVWCARANHPQGKLLQLGVTRAAFRRLCYLELPPWQAVAKAAKSLARDAGELRLLRELWTRDERQQRGMPRGAFGARLKQLRVARGIERRALADLFGIQGKKPARILKYIEEDGFYSVRAFPAGLVALLTNDADEREGLLTLWRQRRQQFMRRRRPETRVDLRLAREEYGFTLADVSRILGYSSLEYQRIERGVEKLLDPARTRILEAFHQAGKNRVDDLLARRDAVNRQREAWRSPTSVRQMLVLLARREGGLAPLARRLRAAQLSCVSVPRLRSVLQQANLPAWRALADIAKTCQITNLADVHADWSQRYRAALTKQGRSPLGVEVRLLIAEAAPTARAFSRRLPFNYSVLVRDLQRIDRDQPLAWYHVERILQAANLGPSDERWQEVRMLWCTASARFKGTRGLSMVGQ